MKEQNVVLNQLLYNFPLNSFINSVVNPRRGVFPRVNRQSGRAKIKTETKMPRRKKQQGACENSTTKSITTIRSSSSGGNKEKPQQRNAANARERARMRVLSR